MKRIWYWQCYLSFIIYYHYLTRGILTHTRVLVCFSLARSNAWSLLWQQVSTALTSGPQRVFHQECMFEIHETTPMNVYISFCHQDNDAEGVTETREYNSTSNQTCKQFEYSSLAWIVFQSSSCRIPAQHEIWPQLGQVIARGKIIRSVHIVFVKNYNPLDFLCSASLQRHQSLNFDPLALLTPTSADIWWWLRTHLIRQRTQLAALGQWWARQIVFWIFTIAMYAVVDNTQKAAGNGCASFTKHICIGRPKHNHPLVMAFSSARTDALCLQYKDSIHLLGSPQSKMYWLHVWVLDSTCWTAHTLS